MTSRAAQLSAAVYVSELKEKQARESVRRVNAKLEEAAEELVWQIENEVWEVLGYETWDEMREAEYGGAVLIVPRADRPELVSRLRSTGVLTQKQIADTLGVTDMTVSRDLKQQMLNEPPATITNARGQQRPTSYAPRITETTTTTETTVIDGETGEVLPAFIPVPKVSTERQAKEQIERGWRDTCQRIAECVRFLEGGKDYAAIYLDGFHPHADDYVAPGMRLTAERLTSAIEFLTAVKKGIK